MRLLPGKMICAGREGGGAARAELGEIWRGPEELEGATRRRGEERSGAVGALQWPLVARDEGRGRRRLDSSRGAKPNI